MKPISLFLALIVFLSGSAFAEVPLYTPSETARAEEPTVEPIKDIEQSLDLQNYLAYKHFSNPKEEEKDKEARKKDPVLQQQFILKQNLQYDAEVAENTKKAEARRLELVNQPRAKNKYSQTALPSELLSGSFFAKDTEVERAVKYAFDSNKRGQEISFKPDPEIHKRVVQFLRKNVRESGMPLSYKASLEDWRSWGSRMDEVDSTMERIIIGYSVSIYDAAVWQIALSMMNYAENLDLVNAHTQRLTSGRSGDLQDIRAYQPFRYGDKAVAIEKEHAFFFRIITDSYFQPDPKTGREIISDFPNLPEIHHEDWKPITGEQAWGAIIGPLQVAFIRYGGKVPIDCEELRLALSILPAIEAMQSPIGAIYHAPHETHGKLPEDISNENNFSMYAALKMLHKVVKDDMPSTAVRIQKILKGMEDYFKTYSYDWDRGAFYQGGYWVNNQFIPTKVYAADCQTWGIIVLGPQWIDEEFGTGAAMQIWQNTKKHSGYFDRDGVLRGVGFTDGHRVLSVEWTCGAILCARILAREFESWNPQWADEVARDAVTMREGVEEVKIKLEDGSEAYLYANKRNFIPFGWWANAIPSLVSSGWVLLIDYDFDPFVLGGGPHARPVKT